MEETISEEAMLSTKHSVNNKEELPESNGGRWEEVSNQADPGQALQEGERKDVSKETTTDQDQATGEYEGQPTDNLSSFLEEKFKLLPDADLDIYEKASDSGSTTTGPLIQRVPDALRRNKNLDKYFEPKVFSFGPIHHGNERLQKGEQIKLEMTVLYEKFIGRNRFDLYGSIAKQIQNFKECYDKEVVKKYKDEELSWMLFVDGCALLYLAACTSRHGDLNSSYSTSRILPLIAHARDDVFLLENQLPYAVLVCLLPDVNPQANHAWFSKGFPRSLQFSFLWASAHGVLGKKNPKEYVIHKYFHRILSLGTRGSGSRRGATLHLLDLLWTETSQHGREAGSQFRPVADYWQTTLGLSRSVQGLRAIGIRVKPSNSSKHSRISFKQGRFFASLELRPMTLDKSTATLLANLMAYEMCLGFKHNLEVTSYLCFFNSLVANANDLSDLRSAGVLYNLLPNDIEAFELLHELTSDLVPNPDVYGDLKQGIERYLNHYKARAKIASWLVEAAQVYFRTPWSTITVLAAFFAIIVSTVQTYFTIFPRQSRK